MKKIKEFLIFPSAVILLIGLFIVLFLIIVPSDAFYGGWEYLKLMITDKLFISAVFITFSIPSLVSLCLSSLGMLILFILNFNKKIEAKRKNYYITAAVISAIASFGYFALFTDALKITDELNVSLQMGIFAVIFSLLISIIIAFVFWIIELIVIGIKKIIKATQSHN